MANEDQDFQNTKKVIEIYGPYGLRLCVGLSYITLTGLISRS